MVFYSEAKVVHQKFYAAEGDLTTMLNVYKVRETA